MKGAVPEVMKHVSFVLLVLRGTSTLNMVMCSNAAMEQDLLSAKKQGHYWLNKFRSLKRFYLHLDCDPKALSKEHRSETENVSRANFSCGNTAVDGVQGSRPPCVTTWARFCSSLDSSLFRAMKQSMTLAHLLKGFAILWS